VSIIGDCGINIELSVEENIECWEQTKMIINSVWTHTTQGRGSIPQIHTILVV